MKYDGWRIIARRQGGEVRLWTRQANDVTSRFNCIAAAVKGLPGGDLVLDNEAICQTLAGSNDFHALLSARACEAVLVSFDILELGGADVRPKPLAERRLLLSDVVGGSSAIMFSDALEGDGGVVFEHACRLGLEGIVSKRIDRPYRSGRTPYWIKTKNPAYGR